MCHLLFADPIFQSDVSYVLSTRYGFRRRSYKSTAGDKCTPTNCDKFAAEFAGWPNVIVESNSLEFMIDLHVGKVMDVAAIEVIGE